MLRIPVVTRGSIVLGAALLLFVALGCGQQQQEPLSQTTADSLLAQNPVEPPPGDLTPQTQFEEPASQPPAPTPQPKTPAPKPKAEPRRDTPPPAPQKQPEPQGVELAAGTSFDVEVNAQLSSETAKAGDSWMGAVTENVIVGKSVLIPAGSTVHGTIIGAKAAERGDRAMLVLKVTSVTVEGQDIAVTAGTDSIIAGSPAARNLGAIAGGAAAGALIGKAVGGSGKGALIGGLIGGAAAGGAVAKSKGYQVVIKEGTVITFKVDKSVMVRT